MRDPKSPRSDTRDPLGIISHVSIVSFCSIVYLCVDLRAPRTTDFKTAAEIKAMPRNSKYAIDGPFYASDKHVRQRDFWDYLANNNINLDHLTTIPGIRTQPRGAETWEDILNQFTPKQQFFITIVPTLIKVKGRRKRGITKADVNEDNSIKSELKIPSRSAVFADAMAPWVHLPGTLRNYMKKIKLRKQMNGDNSGWWFERTDEENEDSDGDIEMENEEKEEKKKPPRKKPRKHSYMFGTLLGKETPPRPAKKPRLEAKTNRQTAIEALQNLIFKMQEQGKNPAFWDKKPHGRKTNRQLFTETEAKLLDLIAKEREENKDNDNGAGSGSYSIEDKLQEMDEETEDEKKHNAKLARDADKFAEINYKLEDKQTVAQAQKTWALNYAKKRLEFATKYPNENRAEYGPKQNAAYWKTKVKQLTPKTKPKEKKESKKDEQDDDDFYDLLSYHSDKPDAEWYDENSLEVTPARLRKAYKYAEKRMRDKSTHTKTYNFAYWADRASLIDKELSRRKRVKAKATALARKQNKEREKAKTADLNDMVQLYKHTNFTGLIDLEHYLQFMNREDLVNQLPKKHRKT